MRGEGMVPIVVKKAWRWEEEAVWVVSSAHKKDRQNRKWGEVIDPQNLPSVTYFLLKGL